MAFSFTSQVQPGNVEQGKRARRQGSAGQGRAGQGTKPNREFCSVREGPLQINGAGFITSNGDEYWSRKDLLRD